ncbi:MAG: hypothetical protein NVS9B13_17610 [Candidatus Acidiferrum sp.]
MFLFGSKQPGSSACRRSERGEGKIKAILVTVIIATGVFAGFRIVPAYVNDYQLKDKMQEIARFSVVNRETEEQIRDKVFKVVDDLDLPVKREEIKVIALQKRVTIGVNYTVPIDLKFYQTEIHFTDSAENSALY